MTDESTADRVDEDDDAAADASDRADVTPPHDAVGAYVLDAMPEEERLTFERHLNECARCRREVAQLAPVVALLPRLFELEPAALDDASANETDRVGLAAAGAPAAQPSLDLRDRIIAAVRSEALPTSQPSAGADTVADETAPAIETAPPPPVSAVSSPLPHPLPPRPRGRILPGAIPRVETAPSRPWESLLARGRPWLAAAALAILAVGSILWGFGQRDRLHDQQTEVRALQTTVADVRRNANATLWTLMPQGPAPASASGTLFYSPLVRTGVLSVHGLQPLPAGKAYQLWYLAGTGTAPKPGKTFKVDAGGNGTLEIPSTAPVFSNVALTAEPETGSDTPTSPILLAGTTSNAAGAVPTRQ